MMESLLRDRRSNIVIKFINDHDAKDHDHLNDHQVRWEGPECDGSHMSLKPWALPSCQKQWRLVLPSGLITNVVFITIVIAIVIIIVIVRRHTDLKSLYLKFIKKFLF